MRWLFWVLVATACGRVGFDPTRPGGGSSGSSSTGDSGSGSDAGVVVLDDGGGAAGCEFIPCDAGLTACCVSDYTSCQASCSGESFACGACPKFMACCNVPDGGSFCAGTCPAP